VFFCAAVSVLFVCPPWAGFERIAEFVLTNPFANWSAYEPSASAAIHFGAPAAPETWQLAQPLWRKG
jgi:hypothetical protein